MRRIRRNVRLALCPRIASTWGTVARFCAAGLRALSLRLESGVVCIPIAASAVVILTAPTRSLRCVLPTVVPPLHDGSGVVPSIFPLRSTQVESSQRCTSSASASACSAARGALPKHGAAQTPAHHVGCKPHRLLQTECFTEAASAAFPGCSAARVRGTMTTMKCLFCGKPLPEPVPPRKHYCDSTCRGNACRERQKKESAQPPTPIGINRTGRESLTAATLAENHEPAQDNHRKHHRSAPIPIARIPMEQQLLLQAPDGATAYRLVLPPFPGERLPRFSPPIDEKGQIRSYSLSPFEQPDDIHLFDGQMYRVLWIGASGQLLPPKQNGSLPGLRFWLGPPEPTVGAHSVRESTDHVKAPKPTKEPQPKLETSPVRNEAPAIEESRPAHKEDPFWSPESIAAQVTLGALTARSNHEAARKQSDRPYRVEAWPSDFGAGPLCNVISQIIEHADRTPMLDEDTAKLDEKARTNLQRWTAKTHEELRLLRHDADSLSYDAEGRLLSSDKTDGFLKQRLFPLIDRWDALFGAVTPERPPKESLSSLARRILLRVWHGLLFWLRNQGMTPDLPLHETFSEARHHAQHWVPKGTDPAGHIIAVVRSGYVRDGAIYRRAHVVVTK